VRCGAACPDGEDGGEKGGEQQPHHLERRLLRELLAAVAQRRVRALVPEQEGEAVLRGRVAQHARVDKHMPVGQHERVHGVRVIDDGQPPVQLVTACRKVGRLAHRAHEALRSREHRVLHHIASVARKKGDAAVVQAEETALERRRRLAVEVHRQQDLLSRHVARHLLH